MPKSVNEVHLIGRAGKDAESRYVGSKQVVKFSLATGGGKKKDGSGDWPTDWHNIEAWDIPGADGIEKGGEIELWGRIKYDSWEKNGQKHYMTKIVATKIAGLNDAAPSSDRHDFAKQKSSDDLGGFGVDQSDIPW